MEKQLIASAQEASREISRLRTALMSMELDQVDEDADGSNIKISDWDLATPSNPPPSDPDLMMNSDYSQSEYTLSRDVSDLSSSTDKRRNGDDSRAYLRNVMVPFDEQEEPESRHKRRRGGSGNKSVDSGSNYHDNLKLNRDDSERYSSDSARESNSAGNGSGGTGRQSSGRSLLPENIVRQSTQRSLHRDEDIDGQGHLQHHKRQDQGLANLPRNPSMQGDVMRQASTRSLQQFDDRGGTKDPRDHNNSSYEESRFIQPPVRQQSIRQLPPEQSRGGGILRDNSVQSIDSGSTHELLESQFQRNSDQASHEQVRMPSHRNLLDSSSTPPLQGQVRQQSQRSLETPSSGASYPQRQQADNNTRSNDGKLRSMPPKRGAMTDLFKGPLRTDASQSEIEQEEDNYLPGHDAIGNRQQSQRNIQTDRSNSSIPAQLTPQRQQSQGALHGQSTTYEAALRQPSQRSLIAPMNSQYENPNQMLSKQSSSGSLKDSIQLRDSDHVSHAEHNREHQMSPSSDGGLKSLTAVEERQHHQMQVNYPQPMGNANSNGMGIRQASARSLQSNYSIPEETPDDISEQSGYGASTERNTGNSQTEHSRLPALQQQNSARNVMMRDAQPIMASSANSYSTQVDSGAAVNRGQFIQQQSHRNMVQGQSESYSPQGLIQMQSRQPSTRSLNSSNTYSTSSFIPEDPTDRGENMQLHRAESNRSIQFQDQQHQQRMEPQSSQQIMAIDSRQSSQRSLLPSDDSIPEDIDLIRHEQRSQQQALRHEASNRSLASNYSIPEEFLESNQRGLLSSSNYHLDFLLADEAPESLFPEQSVVAGH